AQVGGEGDRPAAARLHLVHQGGELIRRARDGGDARAGVSQGQRDRAPDATAGAGDEGRAAGKLHLRSIGRRLLRGVRGAYISGQWNTRTTTRSWASRAPPRTRR